MNITKQEVRDIIGMMDSEDAYDDISELLDWWATKGVVILEDWLKRQPDEEPPRRTWIEPDTSGSSIGNVRLLLEGVEYAKRESLVRDIDLLLAGGIVMLNA